MQDEIDAGFELGARFEADVERWIGELYATNSALDDVVSGWINDPVSELQEIYRLYGRFRRVPVSHREHLLPFLEEGVARILEKSIEGVARILEKSIESVALKQVAQEWGIEV